MHAEIHTFPCEGGEILRVQLVRLQSWQQLEFLAPLPSENAFESFDRVYRQFLIPGCPWIFGNVVLFRLPEELAQAVPPSPRRVGAVADPLTAAAAVLRRGVRMVGAKPVFTGRAVRDFWHALEKRDCLRFVRGKLPMTTIIPVGNAAGYLSETEPDAELKANASFFIMDPFDCATVYDHVGEPFGMRVKDGFVESPPLFGREALLVHTDGCVSVEPVDIRQMEIEIDGRRYRHGENAVLYTRPEHRRTPPNKGTKLVVVGCRVAAVSRRARVEVPASGFVLCAEDTCAVRPGDAVTYHGMENVAFGLQVGNSIVRSGQPTTAFVSRFYNIRKLEKTPFPPSLYPMDFAGARAARMALGADAEGRPMLLWAEGAGKLGYTPGTDSCGASLADMARVCCALGMVNGVNLDGGGSAQILLHGRRALRISDRKTDNTDSERPVPQGLIVR